MSMRILLLPALLTVLLAACGDSDDLKLTAGPELPPPPSFTYSAEVIRTEYGIPHVTAEDWGSLGYGYGYAYAQDNFCVTMRETVFASGRSAELMGEAEGDVDADFLMRYLNGSKDSFRESFVEAMAVEVQDLGRGFARGMNRYLRETGVDKLPEGPAGCRDANWVFEIDDVDLWMFLRRFGLSLSSDNSIVRRAILDTAGPARSATAASVTAGSADWGQTRSRLRELGNKLLGHDGSSNAIALGRDITQTGTGMLLGNPHQPWDGAGRWYEIHLTIPGEYDVAGVALQGLPIVGIGFNDNVAWTHTTSFSTNFTLYELALNPDDPLQYRYDEEWRDIEVAIVSIDVMLEDGSLETREHTFYKSHYGPIINLKAELPLLDGWPMLTGTVLAMRDANIDSNLRTVEQFIRVGQATNMTEFTEALQAIGLPLFHTLAADREGEAFYGEVSVVPHVTQAQLDECVSGLIGPLLATETNNAFISLDGSRSHCEWGRDEDSPPGTNVYGYAARPKVLTTDYVANSNNSYWLSDANNPLTGFPAVFGWLGHENQQQFMRTRLGHLMVEERRTASDGFSDSPGFTLDTLQALMYANRVHGAELVLDDVLDICSGIDAGAADVDETRALAACAVLAAWDRKVDLDSRGAQLFTEFWKRIREEHGNLFTNVVGNQDFWAVDFDPADPLYTPRGIDTALDTNRRLVIGSLSGSVLALDLAGVQLDAPWRDVQYYPRNGENIPIHGGDPDMGVYGDISAGLDTGGYSDIRSGSSYIQTVSWDETDCPIADAILIHSQSTDPESDHFGDQTRLYSRKEWVHFPYCEDDIVAAQIGETLLLQE